MERIEFKSKLSTNFKNFDFTYDYSDTYLSKPTLKNLNTEMIVTIFSNLGKNQPGWIKHLMQLRNKVALTFKLKQTKIDEIANPQKVKVGEKLGPFPLLEKREDGIILGKNDKHLDFRLLILFEEISKQASQICVTTLVRFHNSFGRLYFKIIKPFHKIIIKQMVANIDKQLNI
ncbi:MAG: DUF2867 domain-containing protein [Agriterribacter sp.]